MKPFIERLVRDVFRACGFSIHRKGKPSTTMAEALDHISDLGFRPRTVIDVGVAYGTFELYERFPKSKHLLIEPLREYERVLQRICGMYDGDYVLAVARDKPGIAVLNVHHVLAGSSVFKETDGSQIDGTPRKVPAITVDSLCREKNLRGPYLIKADVQGAELKVLDGVKETFKDTEVIILEVSLFQFYEGGPQFFDVVLYMKEHGFVVYDFFGGNNRPLDGALAQVDTVFVKENGKFRKQHAFRWMVQRIVVE